MTAFADINVASSGNHLAAIWYQCVESFFEIRFHRVSIGRSNIKNDIGGHCEPPSKRVNLLFSVCHEVPSGGRKLWASVSISGRQALDTSTSTDRLMLS